MKKKLPLILGLILTVLFSLWYGYRDVTHQTYDNNVNTAQYSDIGMLPEGTVIEQSFIAEEDKLDGILVKTNTHGDHAKMVLNIELIDRETDETVAESSASGKDVKARQLQKFSFDPVTDCRGREYILRLTQTGSDASNGISFYSQPSDEGMSSFRVDGEETDGVLVMKTITRRFDTESFIVMLISVWFIWGFLWFLSRLFK